MRSTIDLAHNLGLTAVAEGVEDAITLDTLVQYGCDSAQGHHFSRALAAEELTPWLTESPFGFDASAKTGLPYQLAPNCTQAGWPLRKDEAVLDDDPAGGLSRPSGLPAR